MFQKESESGMKNQTESRRFLDFAKKIISVPKSEIDKREAEYQKNRKPSRKVKD